jgi:t-SNARE complex subunit (syntaxin)
VYNPNNNEFCMQYEAQVDVITQLEQRVQGQLQQMLQQQQQQQQSTNPQTITIVTKLRRDFERVQVQARSYQESAAPKVKAIRSVGESTTNAAGRPGGTSAYTSHHNQQQQQQQQQTTMMSDEAIRAEQQRLMQVQMQEDRLAAEIMREREEEIRNINRGMHQVNEIYKDLAHIVGQQQEQVDTIETQMDDARANAEAGLKQVEKANERYGTNQCSIM